MSTAAFQANIAAVREPAQINWQGIDLGWAYSDLLISLSRRTRCVQRAYDVLHDALLRFALAQHRRPVDQPNAYLRRVAHSVLIDCYRSESRLESLEDQNPEDVAPSQVAPSCEHLLDIQQRLQALQRILDCLPERCAQVFWMARIEGYTQPDIATRLGISLNMVERHMMRALIDLRRARDLLQP